MGVGMNCQDCKFYYSDDGLFDPYVWGPWCHCVGDCPKHPGGQENEVLPLNKDGVPGFRAESVASDIIAAH